MVKRRWRIWKAAFIGTVSIVGIVLALGTFIGDLRFVSASLIDPGAGLYKILGYGAIGGAFWGAVVGSVRNLWVGRSSKRADAS
jgi:integral membrane sensor domain MASE1